MNDFRRVLAILISGFAVSSCVFRPTSGESANLSWAVVEHENPFIKLNLESETALEHPLISMKIPQGWSVVFRESGKWQPPTETQLFSIIDISPSEQIKTKYSALLNKDSLTFIQIVVQGKYQSTGASGPPWSITKSQKSGFLSGYKYTGSLITNGLLITMTAHSHFWNTVFGDSEFVRTIESIKVSNPPQEMTFNPKRDRQ